MHGEPGLSREDLVAYLEKSHELAGKSLTKKRQKELGHPVQ